VPEPDFGLIVPVGTTRRFSGTDEMISVRIWLRFTAATARLSESRPRSAISISIIDPSSSTSLPSHTT
jgi:hypothetical protein